MKPCKLEMQAFGPYKDKTTVSFDDLHGLYLIIGDTASGKTTIFDAIMYALYGVTSGSERTPRMMHCNYAKLEDEMKVTLEFLQDNKKYRVSRTFNFYRKLKRVKADKSEYIKIGDNYYKKEETINAVLEETDGNVVVQGDTAVTGKCKEILGLEAEQFRKIIMLAQGKFTEFLKANSDERSNILRKLFNEDSYLIFQELLKKTREKLALERKAKEEALKITMEDFKFPPDMEEGGKLLYAVNNDELIPNLDALIANEKHVEQELDNSVNEWTGKKEILNEKKGAAIAINDQFDELDENLKNLGNLLNSKNNYENRKHRMEKAEIALHNVLPVITTYQNAENKFTQTETEIKELDKKLELKIKEKQRLEELVTKDEAKQKEVTALGIKINKIADETVERSQLKELHIQFKKAETIFINLETDCRKKDNQLATVKERIGALSNELGKLTNVDVEIEQCQHAFDHVADVYNGLTNKENGIQQCVLQVKKDEWSYNESVKLLLKLTEETKEAFDHYQMLQKCFLNGQAQVLAQKLNIKIDSEGQAVCPVCGTEFTRNHMPECKSALEEVPSEEEVNKAEKTYNEKEKLRKKQDEENKQIKISIETFKAQTLERAKMWLPDCGDWKQLSSDVYLESEISKALTKKNTTETALNDKKKLQNDRDNYKKEKEQKEREQEKLETEIDALNNRKNEVEQLKGSIQARIEEKEKQLLYQDETEANNAKVELESQVQVLTEQINNHKQQFDQAKADCDRLSGELCAKQDSIANLENEKNLAKTSLQHVLAEYSYENAEKVMAVITIMGDNPEQWLKTERKAQNDFENNVNNTTERIAQLKQNTKDKSRCNLEELQNEIDGYNKKIINANTKKQETSILLANHNSVRDKVYSIKEYLSTTETAWQRIKKLADVATGDNGSGGKMSFERYVMGAVFKEILQMANYRLDRMSGGRYELIHKTTADRSNSAAGLDLDIYDNQTGAQRNVAGLSGGEKFYTSLSLALGLSDAAQQHSGGKRMDTLFIDEGFGSLDNDRLDKVLEVLNHLAEGNRLVGIISHVEKLDESIPQKIRVQAGSEGSTLTVEKA